MSDFRRDADEAARLGHPSYVWRAGQERRLDLVRRWARLDGAAILDAGCGVGMYTAQFARFSPHVTGVEIDLPAAIQAHTRLATLPAPSISPIYNLQSPISPPSIVTAPAEALPFATGSFDVIFSHEVLEHVRDDRLAAAEMARLLVPRGRILIFVPNRLYPFETHGHYWRGHYHFGNTPLINWLPNPLRNRLAPHVRAYTGSGLARLFRDLPVRMVHHSVVYPGFDNVVARRPAFGRILRRALYAAEHTPLQALGLSHFLVLEHV